MKSLIIIASLAALAGCATQPGNYASSGDPYQWRTVSVTNVNLPADAARPDNYTSTPVQVAPQNSVTYSSSGSAPVYTYAPGTVYSAPVVVAPHPYYYNQPQVSIGLGFGVGRHGWLGINQHFGGPYGYAPYSYWPHRIGVFGHRHWSRHHHRHHGPRHHGPRRHR